MFMKQMKSQGIPITLKNYQSSIETPREVDCLCGQDTTFARHPGNRAFRERVLRALPDYRAAHTKVEKMKVTRSILEYMKKSIGSRFLKPKKNGEGWVEIDAQAARDKVSHALRFAARNQPKKIDADARSSSSFSSSSSSSSSLVYEQAKTIPSKTSAATAPARTGHLPSTTTTARRQTRPGLSLSTTAAVTTRQWFLPPYVPNQEIKQFRPTERISGSLCSFLMRAEEQARFPAFPPTITPTANFTNVGNGLKDEIHYSHQPCPQAITNIPQDDEDDDHCSLDCSIHSLSSFHHHLEKTFSHDVDFTTSTPSAAAVAAPPHVSSTVFGSYSDRESAEVTADEFLKLVEL